MFINEGQARLGYALESYMYFHSLFCPNVKIEFQSTLQMADYACKMSDVFNNSLSEIIHF
jgi:hypothetical protein